MSEAIIYGVAMGLAVQFVINMILCILQVCTGGDLTIDWAEFIPFTVYFMVVGAAGSLLYFKAYGHLFIGG